MEDSREKALALAQAALDKKAEDLILLDVSKLTSVADYFLIGSGTSQTHVQAIADGVEGLARASRWAVLGAEGVASGRWALIDLGEVIVHVFGPDVRGFYDLESLWIDAPRVPIPGVEPPPWQVAGRIQAG